MSPGRTLTIWDSCRSSLQAVGLACLIFTDAGRNPCFREKEYEPQVCVSSSCGCRDDMSWARWMVLMQRSRVPARVPELRECSPNGLEQTCPDFAPERCLLLSKQVCPLPCLPIGYSSYKNPWPNSLDLEQRVSVLLLTRCAPRRPLENCLLIVLSSEYAHGLNCSYQNTFTLSTSSGVLEYIFLYIHHRQYWWFIVQIKHKWLDIQKSGAAGHHRLGPILYYMANDSGLLGF